MARPGEYNAVRRSKLAASEIKSTLFDTGGQLKLGRRHRPDYFLVVLIAAIALTGLVVLFSISPAWVEVINSAGNDLDQSHFMQRQIIYLLIGFLAFFAASRVPLDFWRRWSTRILIVTFTLCLLVPILGALGSGLVICTSGACRWYNLGIATFQPAEFLKVGTLIFTSGFLAVQTMRGKLNAVRETLVPLGLVMLAVLFVIVILQNDLGTGVTIIAITLTQLFISGAKLKTIGLSLAAVAAAGVLAIAVAPHRITRVLTFVGNDGISAGATYHIDQALIALGSGGVTGRGLGQSVQAFGWLPEAVNDSIFAILGESFGFIGLVVILGAFLALLARVLRKVDFLENMFLRLIVAGVFGWLAAHLVVNVGAMIGMLPLTGITLPLLSFGGTSMIAIMSSLGIVLAISRYTSHRKIINEKGDADADIVRRRGLRRTHYAGRRSY